VKIQIIGGKVCLRYKGRTLLGLVSKLLKGEGDEFNKSSQIAIIIF